MFSRGNGRTKDGKKVRYRNNVVIVTWDFLKLWLGGMFVFPVDTLIRYTSCYLLIFPYLRVVLHAGTTRNTFFKEIPLIEVCVVSISRVGNERIGDRKSRLCNNRFPCSNLVQVLRSGDSK